MSSLKRLATLWPSVCHASTIFEDTVRIGNHSSEVRDMKCGIWWMWVNGIIFIRDCNTNIKLSRSFPIHEQFFQDRLPRSVRALVVDPIQDLVVVVPFPDICIVTGAEQNRHIFSVDFLSASSLLPHPESLDASLKCQHSFEESGRYRAALTEEPVICGDRIVVFYCMISHLPGIARPNLFIQVIDWRKGQAKSMLLVSI
ncbi:hypothetical protein BDR06DRAFT_589780 [Suillus hirtellus]|nr:hypothetical protein BDR06DRAFT_589780 [Suillus hirtellus]